ncbi:MAG TPA: cupredoxin domain-containing protein, partial [Candidatus Limnocylindria bacterium]|nr:cupredoxin domain-containing protein [Candidatus Limnocylindria bacterium]
MRVVVALLAAGVLTASCAAGQPAPTASGGARVIEITMKEFGFTPATIQLRAGEKVTLRFKNVG